MASFANPNSPVQPQKGVYGWYARKDGQDPITIYVGNAGGRKSLLSKGTLNRGVSELQRNTLTSNQTDSQYSTLDTDFIVGTAILYFERNGYSCVWMHISDEPKDENRYVKEHKPILQNATGAKIRDDYRMRKDEKDYWKNKMKHLEGINEAEKEVFSILDVDLLNRCRPGSDGPASHR
jgi:hypothetical protein